MSFGDIDAKEGNIFKFFRNLQDGLSLVSVGAFQSHEEDGKVIRVPVLKMGVVLEGLPGMDVFAVEDPEHKDINGKDEEVTCYGVALAAPSF